MLKFLRSKKGNMAIYSIAIGYTMSLLTRKSNVLADLLGPDIPVGAVVALLLLAIATILGVGQGQDQREMFGLAVTSIIFSGGTILVVYIAMLLL